MLLQPRWVHLGGRPDFIFIGLLELARLHFARSLDDWVGQSGYLFVLMMRTSPVFF